MESGEAQSSDPGELEFTRSRRRNGAEIMEKFIILTVDVNGKSW